MLHHDALPDDVRNLLRRLVSLPALGGFALGGGTSLALRFGHRLSLDLDFFTCDSFQADDLTTRLALTGASQVSRAPNSLALDVAGVKLEFLGHAYPVLAPPEVVDTIPLLSLPDVAAMKLNAIANRGAKKDFFDVHELLRHVTLDEMIGMFERKYPATDRFTVIRSLAWFDDADTEPDPLSLNGTTWSAVMAAVRIAVQKLG